MSFARIPVDCCATISLQWGAHLYREDDDANERCRIIDDAVTVRSPAHNTCILTARAAGTPRHAASRLMRRLVSQA